MRRLKIIRRKSRCMIGARALSGQRPDDERSPVLATGLKVAVLMLQVIGSLLQLWRR